MASVLKVDEIQSTSAGGVLFPTRPSFFVYRATSDSSDQNFSAANTLVTFDTKQHDIGNNFDLSTDTYTVPISGVYQLNWQVRLQSVTSATYIFASLYLNGAAHWGDSLYMYAGMEDPQSGNYLSPSTSATVQLTANDTLQIYIRVNADTASRIENAGTFFSGYLVG